METEKKRGGEGTVTGVRIEGCCADEEEVLGGVGEVREEVAAGTSSRT